MRLVRGGQPVEEFLDHGDGTLTDINTGLMWAKCSEGLSGEACNNGDPIQLTWADALARAENATLAGYNDWRLASIKEMQSLVDHSAEEPALNPVHSPSTPNSHFWSSSPFFGSAYCA